MYYFLEQMAAAVAARKTPQSKECSQVERPDGGHSFAHRELLAGQWE